MFQPYISNLEGHGKYLHSACSTYIEGLALFSHEKRPGHGVNLARDTCGNY
jgi:hypothetical protein